MHHSSAKSDYKFSFQHSVLSVISEVEGDAELKGSPAVQRMDIQFIMFFFDSGLVGDSNFQTMFI